MGSVISVRDQAVPTHATVVLHMGRGDSRGNRQVLRNIRRGHDHWFGVLDSSGRFAVSAYVLDGLDEATLLAAVPNDTFGRSTVGDLTDDGFLLLPTTIRIPPSVPAFNFQPWHFSILLPVRGEPTALADDDELWQAISEPVEDELARLFRRFEPRQANPYRS